MLIVYAIIEYLHSGQQRLWRGEGASGPACWRQAGLDALFLLGWLVSERVLQSEAINARSPLDSTHDARSPPSALADFPHLSEFWVGPRGLPWLLHLFHSRVCTRRHAAYYQRKGQ